MAKTAHNKTAHNKAARKKINLALQGGGAHGAFTWGVLEGLLEDERIEIEGISGTSAGAVNAVIAADGLAQGGAKEACERLAKFWRAVSLDGELPTMQRAVIDRLFSFLPLEGSPTQMWFDALSRFWSPYDLNPLNINPLKDVLDRFVDFDALRACPGPPLFVSVAAPSSSALAPMPIALAEPASRPFHFSYVSRAPPASAETTLV